MDKQVTLRIGWEMVGDISYDKPTLQLLRKKYSLTLSLSTNLALMQLDALEKHLVLSSLFSAVLLYI